MPEGCRFSFLIGGVNNGLEGEKEDDKHGGGVDFHKQRDAVRGLQLETGGGVKMRAQQFRSLEALPGDPDQAPPGFRRRFAIKLRRSFARVKG
jgi:hypothetical protein